VVIHELEVLIVCVMVFIAGIVVGWILERISDGGDQ
jgi:hypothetical protein